VRVLITGASGFLGSHLAAHLLESGHILGLLLRQSSSTRRLGEDLASAVLRFADTKEAARATEAFRPDVVVHAACSYGRAGETIAQMVDANVQFGVAVLEGAVAGGARAFQNIGTPLPPEQNFYALTKSQFLALARRAPRQGTVLANIRLQTMYGPGDDASKFTTHLVAQCVAGAEEIRMTPGEQLRDFIEIDDVVSGLATLVLRHAELADGEDIDLGSGEARPLSDFARLAVATTGGVTRLSPVLPYRANEPREMRADIARLRQLGWSPRVSLEEGITRMVAEMRSCCRSVEVGTVMARGG
jgi:CDP-paratose synthetase